MERLEVRLFGDVLIEKDGRPVHSPPGKSLELLCYLLLHRGRPHNREIVSGLLWPDADPPASRKYLRQALWRLNTTAHQLVRVDARHVGIRPEAPCWLDVGIFEQSYLATRDTPGNRLSGRQADEVEAALALYRGDLLVTRYFDWCDDERERYLLAYLAMLDQMTAYCEEHDLYAKGVGFGQAVLSHDAGRESTHRRLMRLHYAAGNRPAALRQYERCASLLAEEFGVRPSAETTALHQQIQGDRFDERPLPPRSSITVGAQAGRARPATDRNRDEVQVVMPEASYRSSLEHILAELDRLDVLLGRQVRRVRRTRGGGPGNDDAEAGEADRAADERLDELSRQIGERVAESVRMGVYLRLVALAGLFGLRSFDVEIVLMCLAPEVARRYELLYAYLHEDTAGRLPTVDLALDLLCAGEPGRVAARARFTASAPLLAYGLVELVEDPSGGLCSSLNSAIRLDPRVTRFLLDDDEPAEHLRPYARVVAPAVTFDDLILPAGFEASLRGLADHVRDDLVVYCQGSYGVGRRAAAQACCQRWRAQLLVLETDLLAAGPAEEFPALLRAIDREARLQGAAMYWDHLDVLLTDEMRPRLSSLLAMLAAYPGPAFLAGEAPWAAADLPEPMTFVRLEFPVPGYPERLRHWRAVLGGAEAALDLPAVSGRFRLTGGQIRDAAATARHLAHARTPAGPELRQEDLEAACRLQSGRRLGALAQRLTPRCIWADLVLPADRMEQLREIADQVRYRAVVHETWGFERKLVDGRGLAVLFAGPPGTGKTMAAGVLAHELALDLYRIDLSTVVSKYIGETEKNLARIFAEAASSSAVLFFDEADALFGKRSAVRDSHDRYANLEVSYLLQRLEEHDGVVILATNLHRNLDDAFVRRLHATVEFPLPDVADRRRIWQQVWPAATPLDPHVDLDVLAREVDLPGGNIRNIALAGAFLAAADGGVVTMAHLRHATRREFQKMGKVLTAGAFGGLDEREAHRAPHPA